MIGILILIFFLTAATAWALTKPHFVCVEGIQSLKAVRKKSDLLNQKARLVSLLRDLDLDNKTGKIAGRDYDSTKKELSLELAKVLEELDAL